jgi:hypothetical protein
MDDGRDHPGAAMSVLAEPRDLAELTEIDPAVPPGDGDRFSGYGVMGLPFVSGHVLALRRFPASSLGYGYSSVWHRDPEGRWTFWSDNSPDESCARFFGPLVERVAVAPIRIRWTGPRKFNVVVDHGAVDWKVELGEEPAAMLLNTVGSWLPESAWRSARVLQAMSRLAGPLLHLGQVRLVGRAPNGQRFMSNPQRLWVVSRSCATVNGVPIGPPGALPEQVTLGEFAIPQRGVFAIGQARFESFDPSRHSRIVSRHSGELAAVQGPVEPAGVRETRGHP